MAAVALIVVQVVMAAALIGLGVKLGPTEALALNAPLFWLGLCVTIKRVHDIGRSAWWIPMAIGGWLAGSMILTTLVTIVALLSGLVQDVTNPVLYALSFALVALPAFGGLMWLHTVPGDAGPNFYGAVPDASGFATPVAADIIGMPGNARASLA